MHADRRRAALSAAPIRAPDRVPPCLNLGTLEGARFHAAAETSTPLSEARIAARGPHRSFGQPLHAMALLDEKRRVVDVNGGAVQLLAKTVGEALYARERP